MEQDIPDSLDKDADPLWASLAPLVHLETLAPFTAPIARLDIGRRKPGQRPTGTALLQFKRDLARAWRLMLALHSDEAVRMVELL
jgi:hypothetical protein